MLPKVVFSDIDGVWTDGGMYYDATESEFKKFNTADSAGVLFLRILKIPLVVVTGEQTPIVARRCKKLKIESFFLGANDKLQIVENYCLRTGIALQDVAYIGDDINDMKLLSAVGYSAVPAQAPEYVSNCAKMKLTKRGGEGVFREFVEKMISENGMMQHVLGVYLNEQTFDQ